MKEKGINKSKVIEISKLKNEPRWMRDFRINSFNKFKELLNPSFGPELKIDFDDITYYKKVWRDLYSDADNKQHPYYLPDGYYHNPDKIHMPAFHHYSG